ncbi:MAG: methyltransferase domain-containing protein [Candidatus Hydrogenedentes bacterium]|nr:methyltransferase domain-containing protein [Candidatus Hydrogenedentota bacterium]
MTSTKRDFNAEAATWDEEPRRVKLASDVFRAIAEVSGLRPAMTALDFGCGTGLVTLQLASCVAQVTGADSSRGMLDVLEEKARSRSIDNVTTRLVDLDRGDVLEGSYDLAVSTMALHHIRDVPALLRLFAQVLKAEGQICLADLDSENGEFHANNDGVFHFGFDREALKRALSEAGFSDLADSTAAEIEKPSADGTLKTFSVFLISGRLRT